VRNQQPQPEQHSLNTEIERFPPNPPQTSSEPLTDIGASICVACCRPCPDFDHAQIRSFCPDRERGLVRVGAVRSSSSCRQAASGSECLGYRVAGEEASE